MDRGTFGKLRSTDPPITIPAWTTMMTGKSPGTLGLYGFRNRADYTYDGLSYATSLSVKEKAVWDILSRKRKRVILLGVPQTYPPKKVRGYMISGIITPDITRNYTYPKRFKKKIKKLVGEYHVDVEDFRTEDKERILNDIYSMTEQRFTLARYLISKKKWDFFMVVDMGPDRLHHGFWKFFDKNHPKYTPQNPFEDSIREYYVFLDTQIAKLIELIPEDTTILVVSDHGAQPMKGAVAINEWLIERGYLCVKEYPTDVTAIDDVEIDWKKTKAWGAGGYYSRIFLNVRGREPQGVIPPDEYQSFRDKLIEEISNMTDDRGTPLKNICFVPEQLYRTRRGIPPDIFVYLGNLSWRSSGSLGHKNHIAHENFSGPDGANHTIYGFFCLCGSTVPKKHDDFNIIDIAPTILTLMGVEVPNDMEGTTIV
jgi:predicted AlkP superfamily phosphohydrolase/phosphomutase